MSGQCVENVAYAAAQMCMKPTTNGDYCARHQPKVGYCAASIADPPHYFYRYHCSRKAQAGSLYCGQHSKLRVSEDG